MQNFRIIKGFDNILSDKLFHLVESPYNYNYKYEYDCQGTKINSLSLRLTQSLSTAS